MLHICTIASIIWFYRLLPSSINVTVATIEDNLSLDLLPEKVLERLAILSELLDTLVELIERHLVLEERPAELSLVVDKGDLGDVGGLGGYRDREEDQLGGM